MIVVKKLLVLLFIVGLSTFNYTSAGGIDLTVSPIKYEINGKGGESITKTAKLINLSNKSLIIKTRSADFESDSNQGKPTFVKINENNLTGQELSRWITISKESFEIGAKEEKDIEFTIDIPDNATPGGHYGAIFFKNIDQNPSGQISINVDYGILILINIEGEINTSATIGELLIVNSNSNNNKKEKDSCFFNIDLSENNYDGKCYDFSTKYLKNSLFNIKLADEDRSNINAPDFNIQFEIPIDNEGNTHIKPIGEIKLIDENGNEIKNIGKKILQNEAGAITGEKIVDFLPINDIGGNILPATKRIFKSEWKGFPYKSYDSEGNPQINYWSPNEFYSQQNIANIGVMMPWERVAERYNYKNITAKLQIRYKGNDGEDIKFNSAQDFYIEYKEKYIGLNPLIIISIILFGFILIILWFISWKRKKRCIKCRKKLSKDMKICPYCGIKQKNK